MAYVDLNPVRADIAKTPEESDYTSIKCRVAHFKKTATQNASEPTEQLTALHPFAGKPARINAKGKNI